MGLLDKFRKSREAVNGRTVVFGGCNAFGDMLMNSAAFCLNCGHPIVFEEGATLAKKRGIRDNVVMCAKCRHVYTVQLGLGTMALTDDVTDRCHQGKTGK